MEAAARTSDADKAELNRCAHSGDLYVSFFVARGARFMGRFHVPRAGQTRDEHDGGDETEGGRGGSRCRHHRGVCALASVVDFSFVYVAFLNESHCVVHCIVRQNV